MIGMNFISFLVLSVLAVGVSLIMHYVIKVNLISGYIVELVIAWIGAWLGSPVLGHWFDITRVEQVYPIPAVLGSFAALFLARGGNRVVRRIWLKEG